MILKQAYDDAVLKVLQSDGKRIAELDEECYELRQQLAAMTTHNVMLRGALEITHDLYAQASSGYGLARPENPHNYSPDFECCSKEEIAAHSQACEDYDAGRTIKDSSWGIGTYCDEYTPAIEALAATDADLAGLIVCEKEPVYVSAEDLERVMSLGFCKILVDNKARGMSELPLYRAKEQGK